MELSLVSQSHEGINGRCSDQSHIDSPTSNATIELKEDTELQKAEQIKFTSAEVETTPTRSHFFELPYEIRCIVYRELAACFASRPLSYKQYQIRRWYVCPLSKANRKLHYEIERWIYSTWIFRIDFGCVAGKKPAFARAPPKLPPPKFAKMIRHLNIAGWCVDWNLARLFRWLNRAGFVKLKELTVEQMTIPNPSGGCLERKLSRSKGTLKLNEVEKDGKTIQVIESPSIVDIVALKLRTVHFKLNQG